MMKTQLQNYLFDRDDFFPEIKNQISKNVLLKQHPLQNSRCVLLDTFDWRLFNKNFYLYFCDSELSLVAFDFHVPLIRLHIEQLPGFANELPYSPLKDQLKFLAGERALLPRGEFEEKLQRYALLNNDQKTVAWLDDISYRVEGGGALRVLQARAVRGYPGAFQKLQRALRVHLASLDEKEKVVRLLQLCGQNAGDYSSKLIISLNKDQHALDAAVQIFDVLLQKMMMNIEGIKKDLDAEFLHDFRVSIRRTRTGQSQFKSLFPPVIARHRQNFSWLAKKSNALRDLDVYLQHRAYYESLLPPSLLDGAGLFFAEIQKQREKQWTSFCRILDSKKFQNIITSWREFLQSCDASEDEQPTAFVFARNSIRKRYDKVLTLGAGIDEQAPAQKLHRLRIECKKLRYLLEFFVSLFPAKKINTAINHLKNLQDYLGTLNDLAMQQSYLNDFLQHYSQKKDKSLLSAAAIGALISQLHHEQEQMRKKFGKVFARFTGKSNAALFKSLLDIGVEN